MKKITLFIFLLTIVANINAQSLVSITPNTALQGQTLNALITGVNTTFLNSSPGGSIMGASLYLGSVQIDCDYWTTNVIDDFNFTVDFPINTSVPTGIYDLFVSYFDNSTFLFVDLTLPSAVTIGNPTGNITGHVFEDLNQNGIQEPAEPPLSSMMIKIMPGNYTINTNANGDYSFAVNNGTYTISYQGTPADRLYLTTPASHTVTINNNNSSGNDFGLRRRIISVAPAIAVRGYVYQFTVIADSLFQQTANPYGNISQVCLRPSSNSGPSYCAILNSQVQVVNENQAIASITVPSYANTGLYDLVVTTTSPYGGNHILRQSVAVIPTPSQITGKLFVDVNSNGVYDATVDAPLANEKVLLMPDSIIAFSNYNGDFVIDCNNGVKTLASVNNPAWVLSTTPAVYSFTLNNSVASNKNFGFQAGVPYYNSTITFDGFPRCNTQQYFYLKFKDLSNQLVNGVIYVITSSNMQLVSSIPAPDFTSGDTLFWNFTPSGLFSNKNISIAYIMPAAGNQVFYNAYVKYLNGGNVIYTNADINNRTVLCSFDPNDKMVYPPGVLDENFTLMNERLYYIIRFQNTGNDTAFTVQIRDLLDTALNWNSFRLEGASHPVNTQLSQNTGALIFTFNNILLPDSNTNEPLSHGFVAYSMVADSGLADGTRIENTAGIYFDSNDPVITNTTLNTMVYVIPVGLNEQQPDQSELIVMPNPASDYALLQFTNINGMKYELHIYSMEGKKVYQSATTSGQIVVSLQQFKKGMYGYQLIPAQSGKTYRGKLMVK